MRGFLNMQVQGTFCFTQAMITRIYTSRHLDLTVQYPLAYSITSNSDGHYVGKGSSINLPWYYIKEQNDFQKTFQGCHPVRHKFYLSSSKFLIVVDRLHWKIQWNLFQLRNFTVANQFEHSRKPTLTWKHNAPLFLLLCCKY